MRAKGPRKTLLWDLNCFELKILLGHGAIKYFSPRLPRCGVFGRQVGLLERLVPAPGQGLALEHVAARTLCCQSHWCKQGSFVTQPKRRHSLFDVLPSRLCQTKA